MTETTSVPATTEPEPNRWRQATPRILEVLAVNAVPLWGLFHGWSLSTLLVLYWCENLLNTIFVGGRIWLHRVLTHRRGHWTVEPTLQVTTTINGRTTRTAGRRQTTLLANFVSVNLMFTVAHGIFVAVLVYQFLPGGPEPADLRRGLGWLVAGMSVSFVLDAIKLRNWPFAWIRQRADAATGRLLVVHLGIIGGMVLLAVTHRPTSFFAVFIALKLLLELGLALPQARLSAAGPPGWLGWARRFGKPGEIDAVWRKAASDELQKQRADEEVLDHVPA